MKQLFFVFSLLLILFSCKKIDDSGFRVFKIKEGKHRSTHSRQTTYDTTFNLQVIFDSSAVYETVDPNNQWDINKLWGVSDCGDHHSMSSIRFGWRWSPALNCLEIFAYRRMFGEFDYKKISCVPIGETIYMTMNIINNEYELCVDGTCVTMERPCFIEYKKYLLYPYFGGDETAPHDIIIRIKD